MGMWFAPPLIVFHEMKPWEAFKRSFNGCMKNIVPFLLYGVILLGLSLVAMIPLGLGMLILGPTVIASIYVSYKQIFLQ
jgi:uncharacterized membrane protein